ncbi:TRAP transporter large permease [Wukongibacter baidiensis]|uniref:TRAP transporter large permease n=1 Tax=Wukongibacter baidiensis TaxID=1723361 RepID=UPI003D7FF9F1
MIVLLAVILVVCLVLGFPMFMSMVVGSLASMMIYMQNLDLSIVIQQLMAGISSYVLLAIPMFIFAADLMSAGHTATRLVDFVKAIIGHVYGGLAITLAGACTLFGAISGSSQATVVAIGRPLRGKLLEAGYRDTDVNGLIISSANIATLIPPSISMIMYCVLTGTSVAELFIAGIGPGLFIFAMFSVYNYFHARRLNIPRSSKTTLKEKWEVLKKSLLSLGFPVVIIVGIYSGTFSPTEAAAISVLYAFVCEVLIYKSVKVKDLYSIAISTGAITAAVFILIASGQIFSWVITYVQIPQKLTMAVLGPDPSAIGVLFVVTIFFFISCMFVDQIVAFLILIPIFFPVAIKAGIDPIHLGIVVAIQSAIGGVSPPFGCNIFTACAAFDEPYLKVVKGLPAYMIMYFIISILIIFVPQIATIYRFF